MTTTKQIDSPRPSLNAKDRKFALKATLASFSENQTTDVAATLTYFTVQTIFPALLALVSILQLIGQSDKVMPAIFSMIENSMQDEQAVGMIKGIVEGFLDSPGAPIALIVGILVALWSASGYVAAFSRALNKVYRIEEGRNSIKLKILQFVITIVLVFTLVIALLALVLSGHIAGAVGRFIGLGDTAILVWNIVKWPILLAVLIAMVSVLYHFGPNLKRGKFHPLTAGSATAVIVALVSVAGYGFYLANFGNYNKTYGTFAGVIIALLLFWVTNIALLLGATLDAEIERTRQLRLGMPAERKLLKTPQESDGLRAAKEKADRLAKEAHEIRTGITD